MRTVFSLSRYIILIAVIALLVCSLAVFVFGGLTTVTIIADSFGHGEFTAEAARLLSAEMIELIDLFLLGTVLLITAVGLYELFVDPGIRLPVWLSVANLDQLKMNLVAVIIVMLAVLFLGEAGVEWREGQTILEYGAAIALVIGASALAVYVFQRVHHAMHAHEPAAEARQAEVALSPAAHHHGETATAVPAGIDTN